MQALNYEGYTGKNQELSFKSKVYIACDKAVKYIEEWIKDNGVICHELHFNWRLVSREKDLLMCSVRAIDTFSDRAYLFEWDCRRSRFEISYLGMSQKPEDFTQGDYIVNLSSGYFQ